MLEKIQQPYEFLARWRDGKLSGAHVGFITQVLEDGKVISETVGEVMPVDVGEGIGFPLADILEQLHVGAITAMDAAVAEKVTAESALATEKEVTGALLLAVDTLKADKTVLAARVAQLELDKAKAAKPAPPQGPA